jgi:two-component system sensor kinase FixL
MGSMASTLAHELNQPIGAIANYVEAVRDRLVDLDPEELPMLVEALNDAAKDAQRAGDIVRRLREFVSRGEVARTVERLPTLINEASVLGLIGARERGIEARFDLDPYASPVFVDRVQIQQVLINLVRNACEAMKDQEERRVTVTSQLDRPGYARITVADTGPGVAPEIADRLFTAFVSSKQDGMGLGLSICRTIIEANEGRIWMEPGEHVGARFHFTLPLAELEDRQGEQ